MAGPVTEADLMELGQAVRERLDAQDRAIESLVKSFLSFRTEVRENFRIMDKSFEGVGQDFNAIEQTLRALGGGQYLAVIEPDAPEKEQAADEPKPKKVVH